MNKDENGVYSNDFEIIDKTSSNDNIEIINDSSYDLNKQNDIEIIDNNEVNNDVNNNSDEIGIIDTPENNTEVYDTIEPKYDDTEYNSQVTNDVAPTVDPSSEVIEEKPSYEVNNYFKEEAPVVEQPKEEVSTNNINNDIKKSNHKKSDLIILLVIVGLLIVFFVVNNIFNNPDSPSGGEPSTDEVVSGTFYGDGYELPYGKSSYGNWSKTTLSDSDVLYYSGLYEGYIIPVETVSLKSFNVDYNTSSGKSTLYNYYYNSLGKQKDFTISSKDSTFMTLIDDIEYATFNYELKQDNKVLYGEVYIIVKPNSNIVITFMTTTNYKSFTTAFLLKLQEIKITKIFDNETASILDSMTNWNKYSSVRTNTTLGKNKNLKGEWLLLGESDEYWIFDGTTFYSYQSKSNKDKNYAAGTYTSYVGKEGCKYTSITENQIDKLLANNKGKISESDINIVELNMTKYVTNGNEQTIGDNSKQYIIWITVNHGSEGIEGQYGNLKTGNTRYFVKVAD